jgi:hypothetical protein
LDLPGTAPSGSSEPLPGLTYSGLYSKSQLVAAVQNYNTNYVGKTSATGGTNPAALVVPPDYQFGDPIFSQDFRLTKSFTFKEKYTLKILGEMFNAFNISNLTYPSFNLDTLAPGCTLVNGAFSSCAGTPAQTYAFGQPTGRVGQTFGSGGTRAVQVGARFTF